jgi:cytochrome b
MVITLLFCLAGTVGTGLVTYCDQGNGPLAGASGAMIASAYADAGSERRDGRKESAVGELHSILANVTLALVILHILGVGLASVVHRENLVVGMINGRKRVEDGS